MSFTSFLYQSHCEGNIPSSKRIYGGFMILCSQIIIIIATILSFIHGNGITSTLKDLIEMDIIVGSTLIGLTTVSRIFKDGSSVSTNQTKQTQQLND